jgi:hypothetical protein
MKTTLDLPEDLLRAVKIHAAEENRRLKDTMADILRRGLSQDARGSATIPRRMTLPLIECAHEAQPDEEMTPERAANALLAEEAEVRRGAL